MLSSIQSFNPDWLSPPGDSINDLLEQRQISLIEFARKLGEDSLRTAMLIDGSREIDQETASTLEKSLGMHESFWLRREASYRAEVKRLFPADDLEAAKNWVGELPIRDMIQLGWIKPECGVSEMAAQCLRFFAVHNVEHWKYRYQEVLGMSAFRASPSFTSSDASLAAWLRGGEIEARQIACKPWDAARFSDALLAIRGLTRLADPSDFLPQLRDFCAACGVAAVIARAPDGCRASGATRLLSNNKAMLLLSFRYLSDDHFWFTFFHEAGHLLLHRGTRLFVESGDVGKSQDEREANNFAESMLFPQQFKTQLDETPLNVFSIARIAKHIGVSKGLVVGYLQHNGKIPRNHFNNLKVRYTWQ